MRPQSAREPHLTAVEAGVSLPAASAPEEAVATPAVLVAETAESFTEQPHAAVLQLPVESEPASAIPVAPPVIIAHETVREEMPTIQSATDAPHARPEQVLTLDWQTDLTQIETNPEKFKAVQAQAIEEAPASEPKRARPAPAPLDEGPLLQVETRPSGPAAPAPNP